MRIDGIPLLTLVFGWVSIRVSLDSLMLCAALASLIINGIYSRQMVQLVSPSYAGGSIFWLNFIWGCYSFARDAKLKIAETKVDFLTGLPFPLTEKEHRSLKYSQEMLDLDYWWKHPKLDFFVAIVLSHCSWSLVWASGMALWKRPEKHEWKDLTCFLLDFICWAVDVWWLYKEKFDAVHAAISKERATSPTSSTNSSDANETGTV